MYQGTLEAISNRADWYGTIEFINDDTGEVITDLTGVDVKIELRDRDYWPLLTGSISGGQISVLGNGVVEWHFTPSALRNICAGTYDLGILLIRDGITEQELIATLPIIDGIVR